MKRQKISAIFFALVLILGTMALTSPASAQSSTADIVFGLPGTDRIAVGETLEYTLQVQNVTNLYAFDVKVSFDTNYLEIVDSDPATSGTQVANGGFLKVGAVVKNEVQNGTIWFVMTQLNPEAPKSGSGTLISFKLRGKQKTSGSIPLTAPSVQLSNSSSTSVPVTITNTNLTVIESADVAVDISSGPVSIIAGGPFSYTAVISNGGPSPVSSLNVSSSFTQPVSNVTWTCTATPGSSCATSGAGAINDSASLISEGSVTYTLKGTLASTASGLLSASLTAVLPTGVSDPVTTNNSDTLTTPITPVISNLVPISTIAGSPGFSLVVNGSGFTSASQVRWNGSSRTTTFVSNNQLTALINAEDISARGVAFITVFTPEPGGGTSDSYPFLIYTSNPVPMISSLEPPSVVSGSGEFTLVVNGANFLSSSVIRWNENALTTTTLSSTQLTASVPADYISAAGNVDITVFNPGPGGGVSNVLTFKIGALNPLPVISSLSPDTILRGGASYTLTVNGSNFVDGAVVNWNGSERATTFVSSTKLTAAILSTDLENIGTAQLTVTNPPPHVSDGISNIMNVTILDNRGDVKVTLTDGQSQVNAGSSIMYTLTITNDGPASINGITVTDAIPNILTGVSWICTPSSGASCTPSGSVYNLNDVVNIPAGGSIVYQISGTVPLSASGLLTNTANAVLPAAYQDLYPDNNQAVDNTQILPYIPITGSGDLFFPLIWRK